MVIEFFAKEQHFEDHLAPVAKELEEAGVEVRWTRAGETAQEGVLFAAVASSGDLKRAEESGKLVFYFEHGAGQSYTGVRHSSYAGGPGRASVCCFVSPGPHVDYANKISYPNIPSIAAGVPKLDKYHREMKLEPEDPKAKPIVCFSFHWDCFVCPETRSGFEHFKSALLLAHTLSQSETSEFQVVAHCHPRAKKICTPFFAKHQIRYLEDFSEVLDLADVYVCDNSSTIFEFASIGKPVVLLNPPHYRKRVNHGLRFWTHANIGEQAHDDEETIKAIKKSLLDTREKKANRISKIKTIYHHLDGKAAERSAEGIIKFMQEYQKSKEEGCEIIVRRFSMSEFGFIDKGSRVTIFENHAVITDPNGKFNKRVMFSYPMNPKKRLKKYLSKPNIYKLAPQVIEEFEAEVDPLEADYSSNITAEDGFVPADKSLSAEELHVMQGVAEGKSKTKIVYKEKGDFKTASLQRAWDRLEKEGFIVQDEEDKSWKANRWGL